MPGKNTSAIEITNISEHGVLLVGSEELFLAYKKFRWFQTATVEQIRNVERLGDHHLYWPALDVGLSLNSIRYPERYPLVSRAVQQGAAADVAKRRG